MIGANTFLQDAVLQSISSSCPYSHKFLQKRKTQSFMHLAAIPILVKIDLLHSVRYDLYPAKAHTTFKFFGARLYGKKSVAASCPKLDATQ